MEHNPPILPSQSLTHTQSGIHNLPIPQPHNETHLQNQSYPKTKEPSSTKAEINSNNKPKQAPLTYLIYTLDTYNYTHRLRPRVQPTLHQTKTKTTHTKCSYQCNPKARQRTSKIKKYQDQNSSRILFQFLRLFKHRLEREWYKRPPGEFRKFRKRLNPRQTKRVKLMISSLVKQNLHIQGQGYHSP